MAAEMALTTRPGNSRVPEGILGSLTQRNSVGYSENLWENCKAQIDDTGELDLSSIRRSGRSSPHTPTMTAALRSSTKFLNFCSCQHPAVPPRNGGGERSFSGRPMFSRPFAHVGYCGRTEENKCRPKNVKDFKNIIAYRIGHD